MQSEATCCDSNVSHSFGGHTLATGGTRMMSWVGEAGITNFSPFFFHCLRRIQRRHVSRLMTFVHDDLNVHTAEGPFHVDFVRIQRTPGVRFSVRNGALLFDQQQPFVQNEIDVLVDGIVKFV